MSIARVVTVTERCPMSPWSHVQIPSVEYVFREVRSESEMRDVLDLRRRMYEESFGAQEFNALARSTGIDLDRYDSFSRHFALFVRSPEDERVVGSLRITLDRTTPASGLLRRIARERADLERELEQARGPRFPILTHLPPESGASEAIARLLRGGRRVAEAGRLAIDSRHRAAAGRQGIRLARFMVECASAVGWCRLRLSDVVIACRPSLESLYERFGFALLGGTSPVRDSTMGTNLVVMHATHEALSPTVREQIHARAEQIRCSGEAEIRGAGTSDHDPSMGQAALAGSRCTSLPSITRAATSSV
jgi:hypothetical protein